MICKNDNFFTKMPISDKFAHLFAFFSGFFIAMNVTGSILWSVIGLAILGILWEIFEWKALKQCVSLQDVLCDFIGIFFGLMFYTSGLIIKTIVGLLVVGFFLFFTYFITKGG